MTLKNKSINIRNREILLRQLSFISRINLYKDNSTINLLKSSMNEEDFEYLNELEPMESDIDDLKNLFESINEINGWNKSSDAQDFPKQT